VKQGLRSQQGNRGTARPIASRETVPPDYSSSREYNTVIDCNIKGVKGVAVSSLVHSTDWDESYGLAFVRK
jgi:hypothetical protein